MAFYYCLSPRFSNLPMALIYETNCYVDSWSRRNDRHNGLFKYSSNLDTGSQQLVKSNIFVQKPIVKVYFYKISKEVI